MQKFLKLFLSMVVVLLVVVGCNKADSEESQKNVEADSNNQEEAEESKKESPENEKDLVKLLVEEADQHKDKLIKDSEYVLQINDFGAYSSRSYIGEDKDRTEITVIDGFLEPEFYGESEDYELSDGTSGEIGEIDDGYVSFINATEDMTTEIFLGELSIEEGKKKLEKLELRDKDITEEQLKEMLGFDYEEVKYFNHTDTDYDDVSEVWFRNLTDKSIGVRYRNNDADEYDAVDVYVSKTGFKREDKHIETQTVETEQGKKVDILDDGLYVDWYWEQDGYYYNISGNYNDEKKEDDAKKEYNLEVIDRITKEYGE